MIFYYFLVLFFHKDLYILTPTEKSTLILCKIVYKCYGFVILYNSFVNN